MKVLFRNIVGMLSVCVLVSSIARAQDEAQVEDEGVTYAVQQEPVGGGGVLGWLFPGQRVSYEYDVNGEQIQTVAAEEIAAANVEGNVAYSDCCGSCGCDSCGCGSCGSGSCGCACRTGGVFLQADAIMAAYHRTDGMRVGKGDGEVTNIGWDLTPRITLGYQRCDGCGMGFRMRWWDYNHNQDSQNEEPGEFIKVDTYNFDLEFYDTVQLSCNWSLELSGGFRRTEFDEFLVDTDTFPVNNTANRIFNHSAEGKGILIGLEGRRRLGCWGAFYGGLKTSVLMGDKTASRTNIIDDGINGIVVQNSSEIFNDSVFGQIELSVGIEKQCCFASGTGFVRVGAEMQDWYNFTNGFDNEFGEQQWDAHSDVGFAMFMASVGFVQ